MTFFFLLMLSSLVFAQNMEGTIYYNEIIKLDIELPKGQEHLREMIPSSRKQSKVLYFTADKSLYKDLDPADNEQEINDQTADGGEIQIKVMSASADNRLLKDFKSKKVVDQRDFLGKKFLINGNISKMEWKITTEQKKILNYVCQKAILKDAKVPTIAWFTAQIPLPNGPDTYGQLPGMILEIDIEEGKRVISAIKIDSQTPATDVFETPTKGKKVSREKFEKIREEKLKEMGGGNGRAVIRMEMDTGN